MDNEGGQHPEARIFYKKALTLLKESGAEFMLGGAFAIFHYTGIYRDTKDLDIFCKPNAYPAILKFFNARGYRTEITDIRWIAKIFEGDYFIDIIFDTPSNISRVDDSWLRHAVHAQILEEDILLVAPEEIIWCKIYIQNRYRFDGADINHILLKSGERLDWKRLLSRLDQHWHLLLSTLIMFQFVYPTDYQHIIPRWLFEELLERARQQYELPAAVRAVCLGPLIDQTQYRIDIEQWHYKASIM
ncbi:MAG TPA: nucleotidyltransferase [Chitinophagaceae bacterium]|nr:nucleotidyltransferase [Chitinophagaceae bacterium]